MPISHRKLLLEIQAAGCSVRRTSEVTTWLSAPKESRSQTMLLVTRAELSAIRCSMHMSEEFAKR